MGVALGERLALAPGGSVTTAEVLVHLVAHVVRIRAVLEDQGDLRQAEQADGAQRDQFGHAVHLVLDGNRDQPLDLLGGVPGEQGDHLNRHVGDVGERLDRQTQEGENAGER